MFTCVNGHPIKPEFKKCPECGADPKPIEAKDLIPIVEELTKKVEGLEMKLAQQKPSLASKVWSWLKTH